MRLFLVSLAIAAACLFPRLAEVQDWDVPEWLRMVFFLPAASLGGMHTMFHEIGHTVTFWSYGQLAVPVFNFQDGGGFSQPVGDRSMILQGVIYALTAVCCYWFVTNGLYALTAVIAGVLLVQAPFAFGGEHYMLAVNYMGNGGAVLTGCFCIWRAALNKTYSETAPVLERYINMTLGLFMVGYGFFLCWELIASDVARDVYNQGINGHIMNDFTVIADRLDTPIQRVAEFHLFVIVCALVVTGFLVWRGWLAQREEELSR